MWAYAVDAVTAAGGDATQWGQLGVFLTAIAALAAFARQAYNREVQRSDRLDAENQRLNQLILDKTIPALESANAALKEATEKNAPALTACSEALRESNEIIREFSRERRRPIG